MRKLQQQIGSRGFTLLELIVALSLSVLLLAAIASAINLLWQSSTFGKERITQARLARALFRKMEVDLRSLDYINPTDLEEAEDLLDEFNEEAETQSATILIEGLEDETAGSSFGVIGGPDWLTLTVSLPVNISQLNPHTSGEDQPGNPQQGILPSSHTLCSQKVITYFTSSANQAGSNFTNAEQSPGLIRRLQPNCYGETEQAFVDENVAREVTRVQFRYFDGQQWVTNWDSREFYALPTAIEVTLTLHWQKPNDTGNNQNGTQQTEAAAKEYRYVMALPMSFTNLKAEDVL